jgi:hypothetical protein
MKRIVVALALGGSLGLHVMGRAREIESPPDNSASPGRPVLVASQPIPEISENCAWVPESRSARVVSAFMNVQAGASARSLNRAPERVIRDEYAGLSAVALDPVRGEIAVQDENLFRILVYDRTAGTRSTRGRTEPKRIIGGNQTKIEYNSAIHVDKAGDIYSVNNDVMNTMIVFPGGAEGNIVPMREVRPIRPGPSHRAYGIAIDETADEIYLTFQHPAMVGVYPKKADKLEAPLRILAGDRTKLADPHGIAIDVERQLMYVSNHGATSTSQRDANGVLVLPTQGRENVVAGTGRFEAPSISVYSLKASGDTPPIRVITGPKTQFNWPTLVSLDTERQELFVANDAADSVLVFKADDEGDVAPTRVIKGRRTGLKNPTGVAVDMAHNELLVANMGNHTVTVYSRTANGDAVPLRTIRAAPEGKQALMIGNPGAVAYDTKRDEILVPN